MGLVLASATQPAKRMRRTLTRGANKIIEMATCGLTDTTQPFAAMLDFEFV